MKEDLYTKIFDTYDDPLKFVQGSYPWGEEDTILEDRDLEKWQKEFLISLGDAIKEKEKIDPINYILRLAISSGQGIGKTTLISWLVQWFMSTRQNPKIVCTANTERQLKNIVWRELSKWNDLLINKDWFTWNATSYVLKDKPTTWKADAVPYNESRPESFQGIHEADVLIIFDEASGIPEIIWDSINGTLTSGRCLFIAFSNPTKNSGSFRQCFGKNQHRWITSRVDSREVSFTNKSEIVQDIQDYGEDSDYVRVRIKGMFPRVGDTQFIGSDLIRKCIDLDIQDYKMFTPIIGVDVARFGDDQSVVCVRQGRKILEMKAYRNKDGKQLAQLVIETARYYKTKIIAVDVIGVGASPYDFLRHFGYEPIHVQAGEPAMDPLKYFNKRAEMWGRMREAMVVGLDIPDDPELIEQIECMGYGLTSKLQIQLEKKSDIKKRGLPSPDKPDSMGLTFAYDYNETGKKSNVVVKRSQYSIKRSNFSKVRNKNNKWRFEHDK